MLNRTVQIHPSPDLPKGAPFWFPKHSGHVSLCIGFILIGLSFNGNKGTSIQLLHADLLLAPRENENAQPLRVSKLHSAFDSCVRADLTLPLKELTMQKKDTAQNGLETDTTVSSPAVRGETMSPSVRKTIRKLPSDPLGFLSKYFLKTIRGPRKIMIDGSRDCEEIIRVVSKNLARMRYAYNKMLRENPGLVGNVGFRFVINDSGKVEECKVVEATMNNIVLQNTLVNQILQWRFDRLPDKTEPTIVAFCFWCGA